MKNLLMLAVVLTTFLSSLFAQAPTMPTVSTDGNDVWYYIKFKTGGGAIQDMGNGEKLLTKQPTQDANGQLWKLTQTGSSYYLQSKSGNYIVWSSSFERYASSTTKAAITLHATTVSGLTPAWELKATGASNSMNQFGGSGYEKEIGQWSADVNNPLTFIAIDDMGFPPAKLTEVPLSGKASAPAQKYSLWYRFPSTNWMTSSLPIGNGQFGAMIFGGVKQDEIQFNDKTLWKGKSGSLGGGNYGAYQNFGNIYISNNNVEEAVNYRRELDLENAICRVSYTNKGVDFQREYFSSYPDSVVVIRLTASAAQQISFNLILLDAHESKTTYHSDNSLTVNGKLDLVSYYAKLKIVNEGGTVSQVGSTLKVDGADAVTIILRGTTDFDPVASTYISNTSELPARVESMVNKAAAKNYEALKTSHITDYKTLFNRMSLDFTGTTNTVPTDELVKEYNKQVGANKQGNGNPFLEELYFHYGRYLMIGSSRGISSPSNLQGIWNHINNPPWSSDLHANVNVQMNYWPAEIVNLSELHRPFIDWNYNEAILHSEWKNNAFESNKTIKKELTGSDAGVTPANSPGWVLYTENNIFGSGSMFATNNVSANAWNCMHIWQHYRYTLDEKYLLEVAYPLMKSCSEFWLNRLIDDRGKAQGANIIKTYAPDGTLVAPNEYSPEHGPGSEDGTAHAQQLCWDLFNNTLQAMEVLGNKVAKDAAFKADLEAKFKQLDPGTHVDKNGYLREWKYTEKTAGQNGHRHNSHLMGLFPGNQISPLIDKEVFDAAIKSLNARGDEGTGWSMGWKINLWARSGDAERAHKIVKGAMFLTYNTGNGGGWGGGIYENLLDAHTPFQIDGNFGACAGIGEMIIQSYTDTIVVLPTLPSGWASGSMKGMKAVGNFEVDIDWQNMKATKVVVKSNKGSECRIFYPYIKNATITSSTGSVEVTRVGNDRMVFSTVEGATYTIEFGGSCTTKEVGITSKVGAADATSNKVITVNAGDNIVIKANPTVKGKSYWNGPNGYSAATNDITISAIKPYQAGKYTLAFIGTEDCVSKDTIEINVTGEGAYANVQIPGTIEAEKYNHGGEGVAFHATDATNAGNAFREDGMDIYANDGGYYVNFKNGEWASYTVVASRSANHKVSFMARAKSENAKLEISFNGTSFKQIELGAISADFKTFYVTDMAPVSAQGSLKIELKAIGELDLDFLELDHYYTSNTLENGFYNIQVNGKNWTYSSTASDKTKPTFQAPTTNLNQVFEIKKDGTRYKVATKTGERYINEQCTFGANEYASTWNSFSIYHDGDKYAFQNGGNAGTGYWKYDRSSQNFANSSGMTADPDYPVNFDIMLVKYTDSKVEESAAAKVRIFVSDNQAMATAPTEIVELKLISLGGKVIASSKTNTMNIGKIMAGAYLMNVKESSGVVTTHKFMIK